MEKEKKYDYRWKGSQKKGVQKDIYAIAEYANYARVYWCQAKIVD